MRILHIVQRYWPAYGGAEYYLDELSTRLVADGHQVTVLTTDALDFELFWDPKRRRVETQEDERRGVRILRFPVRYLPLPSFAYPATRRLLWLLSAVPGVPVSLLYRLSHSTPRVPALWKWLDTTKEPFDLVVGLTICFESLVEAGLRFAQRRRVPFVIYPFTHLGASSRPAADALSRFYTMRHQLALVAASDEVVAQTETERDFYVAYGVPEERIIVCGPGVDLDALSGGDAQQFRDHYQLTEPIVGCIASMSYDKGTVQLVEAARRLWADGRSFHLVLAGAVLQPFRRYLRTLPQHDRRRILLLGSIAESAKLDLLAAMDVFAMPSRTESFGIVYLEAWAYGKPVIGAQTWGVSDVIDHRKDGLLVPFGDVPALVEAITELLDHPGVRARMGARGQDKVNLLHTWERKYAVLHRAYREVVSAK